MVSNTNNKEAYAESLFNRSNPAIFSLISFIEEYDLIPLKNHLTIERAMLAKKLTSLKEQCTKTRTAINDLQKLVNQHEEPLLAECLTNLKEKWSDLLTKTLQVEEQISQYDAVLKTLPDCLIGSSENPTSCPSLDRPSPPLKPFIKDKQDRQWTTTPAPERTNEMDNLA